jgi:hypothetical protein
MMTTISSMNDLNSNVDIAVTLPLMRILIVITRAIAVLIE